MVFRPLFADIRFFGGLENAELISGINFAIF